jgi:hypothetical protein
VGRAFLEALFHSMRLWRVPFLPLTSDISRYRGEVSGKCWGGIEINVMWERNARK